jgi:hypothetical protein
MKQVDLNWILLLDYKFTLGFSAFGRGKKTVNGTGSGVRTNFPGNFWCHYLTLWTLVETTYPTYFNNQCLHFFIYVFPMIFSAKRDYFLKQHKKIYLCNGEVWCFIFGTDWIIKYHLRELRPQIYVFILLNVVSIGLSIYRSIGLSLLQGFLSSLSFGFSFKGLNVCLYSKASVLFRLSREAI